MLIAADIFGYLAAFFSIVTIIPQSIKTLKHRMTGNISLWTFVIFTSANCLWLVFGIMSLTVPALRTGNNYLVWGLTLSIAYASTIFFSSFVLYVKIVNIVKLKESIRGAKVKAEEPIKALANNKSTAKKVKDDSSLI